MHDRVSGKQMWKNKWWSSLESLYIYWKFVYVWPIQLIKSDEGNGFIMITKGMLNKWPQYSVVSEDQSSTHTEAYILESEGMLVVVKLMQILLLYISGEHYQSNNSHKFSFLSFLPLFQEQFPYHKETYEHKMRTMKGYMNDTARELMQIK